MKITQITFIFALVLSMLLTGCKGQMEGLDQGLIDRDLEALHGRTFEKNPQSVWDLVPILSGFSRDTMVFLERMEEDYEALKYYFPFENIRLSKGSLIFLNPERPQKLMLQVEPSIQKLIEQTYLKSSTKILHDYGNFSEFNPRMNFCGDNSLCISEDLRESFPQREDFSHFKLAISNGVITKYKNLKKQRVLINRFFHYATLIVDPIEDRWAVVDPLVFGDSKPRSIQAWFSQFSPSEKLKIRITP